MKYSRKKITKNGEILMTSNSQEEVNAALEIINEWRSHHLHPLRVLKNNLIKLCERERITPILISQRLKRLTSIEYKLDLNEKMGLGGMQDIGGFRAVLKDVDDLHKIKRALENKHQNHKLEKINDYVQSPKDSGYRSIHFIYKYHSKVEKYNELRLELQIRTKLQHNWATAVETAGIITQTSLKSSKGPDEWLEFFKVVSSLFAYKENLSTLEEHKNRSLQSLMVECYEGCKRLQVIETLRALGVTTKHLEKKNFPGDYYLINIDIEKRVANISVFNKNSLDEASDKYLELEKRIENSKNAVVLVAANSMRLLKKAYPSYFLDTKEFIGALEKINLNCIERGFVTT